MAEMKPKLRVDVNKNPTKAGIKVQFVMPETLEGDAKAEMAQKLQAKLNQGLSQYGLTVSQDTDVPYANVIGFLIPIADVKIMIKKAITGGVATPTPETPAPEEPVAEIERMQELAGITSEDLKSDIRGDLEKVSGIKLKPEINLPKIDLKKLSIILDKFSNNTDEEKKIFLDVLKNIPIYITDNNSKRLIKTIRNIPDIFLDKVNDKQKKKLDPLETAIHDILLADEDFDTNNTLINSYKQIATFLANIK